jgi:hypothetical protein
MKIRTLAFAALLLMTLAPGARALGKGGSMFAIELTHGTADFANKLAGSTDGNDVAEYISAFDHSEVGVQGQYWKMMSEDYALAVSLGYAFFSENDKPGQGAAPGSPELKFSTSSYNIRVGGDRVAKVGDRTVMYCGPGVEYWSGNSKFEPDPFSTSGTGEYKDESVTRISLSARIGAIMMINESFGLTTHVGGRYGYASVKEQGAEATWWPSSVEAAAGLMWSFGGE